MLDFPHRADVYMRMFRETTVTLVDQRRSPRSAVLLVLPPMEFKSLVSMEAIENLSKPRFLF